MYFDIEMFQPFLLILAFWFLVVPFLSKEKNRDRTIIVVFALAIALRYFFWRYFKTVASDVWTPDTVWIHTVYLFELLAFAEVCIFFLIMSRTNNRSEEANSYEKDFSRFPAVDVFIPTYNEGIEILEKSILGAKHIRYPNFKVWVLDDGRREWLKQYCEENAVGYLTRPDNLHAKAGNLNNGLKHTSGELIAVFDADFVATERFLMRTVGFFLHEKDIGIVQTPQHFFNRDPIQLNLGLEKLLPDEQRLFFDSMAASRDGWGAAFCCGSCSILRREAIDRIAGIPTSSITEDLLTTLCMLQAGYRTIYLNEALSFGMSSESLRGYFIQRSRWCRGGIQCFYVPEGPLRANGLTFFQRILFSPYSWIIQPLTRLMMLLVPLFYLWFGLYPLHVSNSVDLIAYQFPVFLIYFLSMRWLTERKYVPLLSTAVNIFGMFRILPVTISSLIKPFGVPFMVTPKGSGNVTGTDWYVLFASLSLVFLSIAGIIVNSIPEYRIIRETGFYHYVVFWTSLNIFLLFFTLLLCFDIPHRRKEERFYVQEPILLYGKPAIIENLSLGGCRISISDPPEEIQKGNEIVLSISGLSTPVFGIILEKNTTYFTVFFKKLSNLQREEMVVKIFTGKYDNEIHNAGSFTRIAITLLKRAFGRND